MLTLHGGARCDTGTRRLLGASENLYREIDPS